MQYLHELFPDLSLDANFEEEPDHQELVVAREDLGDRIETGNVSLHTDYTRYGSDFASRVLCIGLGCLMYTLLVAAHMAVCTVRCCFSSNLPC